MRHNQNALTLTESLFGSFELGEARSAAVKKTYLLLGISVISAIIGGIVGSNSPALVSFFGSFVGWIVAMLVLNLLPSVALAARGNPVMGTLALVGDGFVSGLVLAPILYMASVISEEIVPAALILTAVVFIGVTFCVMFTGVRYSAPRNLLAGIFFSLIGVMVLNMFLNIGFLGMFIACGIGVLGVFILVQATSQVLNNPEYDTPSAGALMLFAGLFNVFVAIMHLLLAFAGRDND